MAVAQFFRWEADGRPWHAVTPIREFVDKLKAAAPAGASFIWTLGDQSHLTSNFPQDHTPFSVTGWPSASPYKSVFACDVSHQPALGLNIEVLFPYWLNEAKSGRMPWLKYIIWRRRRYDVRNNWSPVTAEGHDTHAHLSGRTDHEFTSLGGWSPVPEGDDMFTDADRGALTECYQADLPMVTGQDTTPPGGGQPGGEPHWAVGQIKAIRQKVDTLASGEVDIDALVAALVADEEFGALLESAAEKAMRKVFADGATP